MSVKGRTSKDVSTYASTCAVDIGSERASTVLVDLTESHSDCAVICAGGQTAGGTLTGGSSNTSFWGALSLGTTATKKTSNASSSSVTASTAGTAGTASTEEPAQQLTPTGTTTGTSATALGVLGNVVLYTNAA